ncbi:hypothetical protein Poli38472_000386 [Pythium oligandrum]|uniref:FYVE-type domain-containing protein n=1 Tax=Pythium oligandrum TaxID=41045 RepID=A0A8K1FGT5_PYTOL|nr:hypothetical protein Poli38472_000386 [Pythium oligandrum]|eukprot:TMW60344.1 hypothetical protein Poli38472_000386 [Pythium oligandrum]
MAITLEEEYPQRMSEVHMRKSALFKRVSAQAMGMEANALCQKAQYVPKSTRSNCSNCQRSFRMWSAKHHCRICGDVVCGSCSAKRILFQTKSVRTCDECVNVNVRSISQQNRRKSGADLIQYSPSSDEDVSEVATRRIVKRRSESDLPIEKSLKPSDVERENLPHPSELHKSTQAIVNSASKCKCDCVEAWRLQLPYAIVVFLLVVAFITNLKSYL